jgi:hypothetical protein
MGGGGGGSSLGAYGLDQHGLFGNPDPTRHDSTQGNYILSGPSGSGGVGLGSVGDVGISRHDDNNSPPARPKKGRTNTPWTPAEEQRLKVMRDAGNSWSEIAKTFPTRTEGSVKKHWYKVCFFPSFPPSSFISLPPSSFISLPPSSSNPLPPFFPINPPFLRVQFANHIHSSSKSTGYALRRVCGR